MVLRKRVTHYFGDLSLEEHHAHFSGVRFKIEVIEKLAHCRVYCWESKLGTFKAISEIIEDFASG